MLLPKHNKIHHFLLDVFLKFQFKKHFEKIEFIPLNRLDVHSTSVLLIGNHSTWWDGFIGWELNKRFLKKKFFIMMLETQLKRFWFFQYCGAFSINPGFKSVSESLQFANNLLKNPNNLLQFYPQGKFYSLYDPKPQFQKGMERILKNNQMHIILYALLIDYADKPKPSAFIYLKQIEPASHTSSQFWEQTYHEFFRECLALQCNRFLQ